MFSSAGVSPAWPPCFEVARSGQRDAGATKTVPSTVAIVASLLRARVVVKNVDE
jgi:hypothetical protein